MNLDREEKQDGQGRTRQPEDLCLRESILSDPDWMAWLSKDNTDHLTSKDILDQYTVSAVVVEKAVAILRGNTIGVIDRDNRPENNRGGNTDPPRSIRRR